MDLDFNATAKGQSADVPPSGGVQSGGASEQPASGQPQAQSGSTPENGIGATPVPPVAEQSVSAGRNGSDKSGSAGSNSIKQPSPEQPDQPESKKSKLLPILLITLIVVILGGLFYYFLLTDSGKQLIGLSLPPKQETSTFPVGPKVDTGTVESTADSQRKSDLAEIQTALEAYNVDNGAYPISSVYSKIDSSDSEVYNALVASGYLTMPVEPKSADGWWYGYKSVDGKNYILTARLEDESDLTGTIRGDIVLYELTSGAAL